MSDDESSVAGPTSEPVTQLLQLEWKQTFTNLPRRPAPADYGATSLADTDRGRGDAKRDREMRDFLDGETVVPKLFEMPDVEKFLKTKKSKKKSTSVGGGGCSVIERHV